MKNCKRSIKVAVIQEVKFTVRFGMLSQKLLLQWVTHSLIPCIC